MARYDLTIRHKDVWHGVNVTSGGGLYSFAASSYPLARLSAEKTAVRWPNVGIRLIAWKYAAAKHEWMRLCKFMSLTKLIIFNEFK